MNAQTKIDLAYPAANGTAKFTIPKCSTWNIFTYRSTATEAQRDAAVLALRKDGYSASRETDTIRTDATITAYGLSTGTTSTLKL